MNRALLYGILKDEYSSTSIISPVHEKTLQSAQCSKCGMIGMAYMETRLTTVKPHFCWKCKPKTKGEKC